MEIFKIIVNKLFVPGKGQSALSAFTHLTLLLKYIFQWRTFVRLKLSKMCNDLGNLIFRYFQKETIFLNNILKSSVKPSNQIFD